MTKKEAINELQSILEYWELKVYRNYREQEAVKFAIDYMKGYNYVD